MAVAKLKKVHYIALALVGIALLLINNFNLDFRGLWTTRICVLVALLTGLFLYLYAQRDWKVKAEKIYFRLFSWLPVAFIVFACTSFPGIIISSMFLGWVFDPGKVIYTDDNLYVTSGFGGPMGGAAPVDVWHNQGLFKTISYSTSYDHNGYDSVSVKYINHNPRIYFYDSDENDKLILLDSVTIEQ
jgi:hypothetical protein